MDSWSKMMEWKQLADKYMTQGFFPNFEPKQHSSGPQINLYQSENELLCVVSLPGLQDIDDVEVYVTKSSIKIRGDTKIRIHGMSVRDEEIFQGKFERDVALPYSVREEPIDAIYQKGLLHIRLYRLLTEDPQRKKVDIKFEDD